MIRAGAHMTHLAAALLFAFTLSAAETTELPFRSHDGYAMRGKLTMPATEGKHGVVIYVQTAEGMTVDMKRPLGPDTTFNYFDLYREKLPAMNLAFFSYDGRGIGMGDKPPRYEAIEPEVYNTSTLDNKVRDVLSAVALVRKQPGIDPAKVFLMGASEGTLLAVQAAARAPEEIRGLALYGVLSVNMRGAFKFIVGDGAYMVYSRLFDTDKDGRISKAEFEADPAKYRARVWQNAGFENFDKDGDGFFTPAEARAMVKPYFDAVDNGNFEFLDRWAKTAAGVATPPNWFKDHFAQPEMWTYLAKLDIPIGFFQGALDNATPIAGVRRLEEESKKAGKSRFEFHYFDKLDHTLGVGAYFQKGKLPEGHQAIFEFFEKRLR
jgi:pimeloyl-ACP methyl ester carboxylesterase